jgi:hypothetical protein
LDEGCIPRASLSPLKGDQKEKEGANQLGRAPYLLKWVKMYEVSQHCVARVLPHTAEAPEALPLVAVGFSLHLAWQPTSIHDGIVQAWVIIV